MKKNHSDTFTTVCDDLHSIEVVKTSPEEKKKAYNLILKMYPDSKDHKELLEMLDLYEAV